MKLYTVIDIHGNKSLATYTNRKRASRIVDQLNSGHGTVRYIIRASKQLTAQEAITRLSQLPPASIGE